MFEENYQALANAIILMVVRDFKPAYQRMKRCPNDKFAQNTVRRLTRFFYSQNFAMLSDIDGPALLNQIMREMDKRGV